MEAAERDRILALLAAGKTRKQIAEEMGRPYPTIAAIAQAARRP